MLATFTSKARNVQKCEYDPCLMHHFTPSLLPHPLLNAQKDKVCFSVNHDFLQSSYKLWYFFLFSRVGDMKHIGCSWGR